MDKRIDIDKLTYTVDETAALMGLGRSSTYEGIRQGQIPSIRVGGRILVPKLALQKLLEEGRRVTAQAPR